MENSQGLPPPKQSIFPHKTLNGHEITTPYPDSTTPYPGSITPYTDVQFATKEKSFTLHYLCTPLAQFRPWCWAMYPGTQ